MYYEASTSILFIFVIPHAQNMSQIPHESFRSERIQHFSFCQKYNDYSCELNTKYLSFKPYILNSLL